ncbi:MAG: hypothetical protein J0H09_15480 [Burkholderiales bacterium]|nr:hypothetical protein [Burkholderiales bacterium]
MHHPIQVYKPDWSTRFCEDQQQSAVSRRKVLEHCAEHWALLFPTHFAARTWRRWGQFRPRFIACRCGD